MRGSNVEARRIWASDRLLRLNRQVSRLIQHDTNNETKNVISSTQDK